MANALPKAVSVELVTPCTNPNKKSRRSLIDRRLLFLKVEYSEVVLFSEIDGLPTKPNRDFQILKNSFPFRLEMRARK